MIPKKILEKAKAAMHDPKIMEKFATTEADWHIADINIRKKIEQHYKSSVYDKSCKCFSSKLFIQVTESVRTCSRFVEQQVRELISKYGKGAVVIHANSVEDFVHKIYLGPNSMRIKFMKHMFSDSIFIIKNTPFIFLTHDMMKMDNLKILDNVAPNQCQIKIVIYGAPEYPSHFTSYDSVFVIEHTRLIQFLRLRLKRLKYKTLKYKYPDLIYDFMNPQNHDWIIDMLRMCDCIKQFINFFVFPKQVWKVIHDERQKAQLKIIKHKLKVEMKRCGQEFYDYCHEVFPKLVKISKTIPISVFTKYQFIPHARSAVIDVIGEDVYYESIPRWNAEQIWKILNLEPRRHKAIKKLMKQMEPKCCDCCGRMEQRGFRLFERFKICKCKEVRYCGRKCQKIHWKKMHRYLCGESVIFV